MTLNRLKLDHFYSSLKSIVKLRSPALLSSAALVTLYLTGTTELITNYPTGLTSTGIGTALAIEVRANWINYKSKLLETIDKSEIAYLYYAEKNKIIDTVDQP
jgi:hypothetical protein